jgi:hypothetical protein
MRKPLRWLIGLVIALLLLYAASPYFTLWRFSNAVNSRDVSRFETYVDFNAVRISLKRQLRDRLPKADQNQKTDKEADLFAGLVERFAPALIDQLVDAFVTPEGLLSLIGDPVLAQEVRAKNLNAIVQAAATDKRFDRSDVRYAFFTGPRDFLVDADGTKLRFRFSRFRWVLRDVELPAVEED